MKSCIICDKLFGPSPNKEYIIQYTDYYCCNIDYYVFSDTDEIDSWSMVVDEYEFLYTVSNQLLYGSSADNYPIDSEPINLDIHLAILFFKKLSKFEILL